MNLERFGLFQDPELGLLQARGPGSLINRAPAVSKTSLSSSSFASAFGALAKKKKTAQKPAKKKPSQPAESTKKTKTKAKPKAKKPPAEKAKAKAKPPKAIPAPGELTEKLKKKYKLVDFTDDITKMKLPTLRSHFGYISGSINKALFVNNIIWQVYRLGKTGNAPTFINNGGNIRSLWYYVKKIVRKHPRVFNVDKDLDSLFSKQLSKMVKDGLLSYKDLNITDDREAVRRLAPVYGNPHIILLGEKISFLSKLIDVGLQYGITVQCSKGMPSLVMADTMLTEMGHAGYDMSQEFIILTFTDFDPTGWNIGNTFAGHLKELGLKNIRSFNQYPVPRDCLDVVCPHDLSSKFLEGARNQMTAKLQRGALTRRWANATGGLYKRGGTDYAVSAEEHLDFFDAMLAEKIAPFLRQKPEAFTKLINIEYLDDVFEIYAYERWINDNG